MKNLILLLVLLMNVADPNFDPSSTNSKFEFLANLTNTYCILDATSTTNILADAEKQQNWGSYPISLVLVDDDMELDEGEKILAQTSNETLTLKLLRRRCGHYKLDSAANITNKMPNYYFMCRSDEHEAKLTNYQGKAYPIELSKFGLTSTGLIAPYDRERIHRTATCLAKCKADCDRCYDCYDRPPRHVNFDYTGKKKAIICILVTIIVVHTILIAALVIYLYVQKLQ